MENETGNSRDGMELNLVKQRKGIENKFNRKYGKALAVTALGMASGGLFGGYNMISSRFRPQAVQTYHQAQANLRELQKGRSLLSEIVDSGSLTDFSETEREDFNGALAVYGKLNRDKKREIVEFENLDEVKMYKKNQTDLSILGDFCGFFGSAFLGGVPGFLYSMGLCSRKEKELAELEEDENGRKY